jgi:hypothetical protein
MPFLHHDLSIVELVALVIAGLVVLAVVVGFLANIPAVLRYLRMRRM